MNATAQEMQVALSAIVFDPSTRVRAATDSDVVFAYAQQMAEGAKFPPVVLFADGDRYYIGDGWYRLLARQKNGDVNVRAVVDQGGRTAAIKYALGANATHGLRVASAKKSLTTIESTRLQQLETVIERGKETFIEVGKALAEVRDSRLYRQTHGTFEDYCQERWGFSRVRAHQLIETASASAALTTVNKPSSERQARPLTKLPPEKQAPAWTRAQEIAKDEGKPVAARHVEAAVAEMATKRQRHQPAPFSMEAWRRHVDSAMTVWLRAVPERERVDALTYVRSWCDEQSTAIVEP